MASLKLILIVAFFICEALATFEVGSPKFNLAAAGLACYAASILF